MQIKTGLKKAHRAFWTVVLVAFAGLLVCAPRLDDRPRLRALSQLDALQPALDTRAMRQRVVSAAEASAAPKLADVVARVGSEVLRASPSGGAPLGGLFVAAPPDLSTLGAVVAAAQPGRDVELLGPDLDALAAGIRWRLMRRFQRTGVTLAALHISARPVSAAQVEREARVEPARLAAAHALVSYQQARERYVSLREHTDKLKAIGASKDAQKEAIRARREAYAQLMPTIRPANVARRRFVKFAKRAARVQASRSRRKQAVVKSPEDMRALGAGLLMVATFEQDVGRPFRMAVPVPRVRVTRPSVGFAVPTPLSALREGPLWEEIAGESIGSARRHLRATLSWHLSATRLAGLTWTGAGVVQWFGALICLLLAIVAYRCRVALKSHSAFQQPDRSLPVPGTRLVWLDQALLVAPGVAVAACACVTLYRVGQPFWGAALLGGLALGLGLLAARQWAALINLRDMQLRAALVPLSAGFGREAAQVPPMPSPSILGDAMFGRVDDDATVRSDPPLMDDATRRDRPFFST